MPAQVPGPICTSRVGTDWIDSDTLCLARTPAPADCQAFVRAGCTLTPVAGGAQKVEFDRTHVYSGAREAAAKRALDLKIIGGDYSRGGEISLDNGNYLEQLIELASGAPRVSQYAKSLQFFIIQGGGEGFLPEHIDDQYADTTPVGQMNAGRMRKRGWTTDGKPEIDLYDENDIIAVFDSSGGFVSAARIERPVSIPGWWGEGTAKKVNNNWDNKPVSIYRNTYWFKLQKPSRPVGQGVIYLGLAVHEHYRSSEHITVDIHKQENTNGCILIVDRNTPKDLEKLDPQGRTLAAFDKTQGKVVPVPLKEIDLFEPKFIVDILGAVGKAPEDVKEHANLPLGITHIIRIH
jgi:hypothetical protein